jgi:zinc D-Ala-D-Ala carboxypeptidase
MDLSKNFTLEEVTYSHKAEMLHIDNSIPTQLFSNALFFAQHVLQPIRDKIGEPFLVSSWYRCPELNKAVGGVSTSVHLSGMALDFIISGYDYRGSYALAQNALKTLGIQFDQLIIEYNRKTGAKWVHLGVKRTGNRNQTFALTIKE